MTDKTNYLNEKETAEYLGVSPKTLQQWRVTKKYNLPYLKICRAVRYLKADIDAFILEQNKQDA